MIWIKSRCALCNGRFATVGSAPHFPDRFAIWWFEPCIGWFMSKTENSTFRWLKSNLHLSKFAPKHSAIDVSRRVDTFYAQIFWKRISGRGERAPQSRADFGKIDKIQILVETRSKNGNEIKEKVFILILAKITTKTKASASFDHLEVSYDLHTLSQWSTDVYYRLREPQAHTRSETTKISSFRGRAGLR